MHATRRSRRSLPVLLAAFAIVAGAGCRSARDWRRRADDRARAYLGAAQRQAGAAEEGVEIETPSDTLRRRLLLDQSLPAFDPASFGIRDLPTNLYWNAAERLEPGAAGFVPEGVGAGPLRIGLLDAVRIAAHNSREFQSRKEALYAAALGLDLEAKAFRTAFSGAASAAADSWRSGGGGGDEAGAEGGAARPERTGSHGEKASLGAARTLEGGAKITGAIAFNLAGMLTGDRSTAWGSVADLGVSIPLLRGAGSLVNRESLTQAERDLVYAVRDFEQYKRSFVVGIEGSYLSLVLAGRTRQNEDDNYRRVILSTRRSRRMADASRMSKAEFDQSHQSELAARASWIGACQRYEAALEDFKIELGLPPDARIEPRDEDLEELRRYAERLAAPVRGAGTDETGAESGAESGGGSEIELAPPESVDEGAMKERADRAVAIAFERRPDVATARDRIEDAQRHLAIAEDALRAEVTIGGTARVGEAASSSMAREGRRHADFEVRDATYGATIRVDLPLERTAEAVSYRNAVAAVEKAVREWQALEDGLKRTVRQDLRDLSLTEERLRIQFRAVELATRRVRNQDLLLAAGRANMTDLLDAQAALVTAQNSLYAAITSFRADELRLQADLGVLDASVDGTWREADLAALGVAP